MKVSISELSPVRYFLNKAYVSTKVPLTAIATITESEKFKNFTHRYQWTTKGNKTIQTGNEPKLANYIFDQPDNDTFLGLTVAFFDANIEHTGIDKMALVVKDSISVADPIGKMFLIHSEILRMSLKFNGTGPCWFCINFCYQYEEQDCDCIPLNGRMTNNNEIDIQKWLYFVGKYKMAFRITNIVSDVKKNYTIQIQETLHKKTLPFVPIICSILAAFILVLGIALNLRFRDSLNTETANFDFTRDEIDEEDEGDEGRLDLLSRIYGLFCNRIGQNELDDPNVTLTITVSNPH